MFSIVLTPRERRLLQGLAAGDRNGGPIRLALLLFQSIRQNGFVAEAVFQDYYNWITTDGYDMGPTFHSVCTLVSNGMPPSEAVFQTHQEFDGKTAGIGPAHRATPLALLYRQDIPLLDACVRAEAKLSHYSPIAADVSVVTVRICAHLLNGCDFDSAIDRALQGIETVSLDVLPPHEYHAGGYAPKVLQTAVNFLRTASTFREALEDSLSFAGHANYCPVLVGVIGACRFGEVPADLLMHPQCPPHLQAMG